MKMNNLASILALIMMCGMSTAVHKTDLKLVLCLEDKNKMGCSHGSKCISIEKVMYTTLTNLFRIFTLLMQIFSVTD